MGDGYMKYMGFMVGRELIYNRFQSDGENDHEHCVICGEKFSEKASDLHCGYCTTDAAHWICEACFEEYHDEYQWNVFI